MKLLLFGYFGSGNRGDEAILESFLELYRGMRPDASFIVLSAAPEETASRYGVESAGKKDPIAALAAMKKCDAVVAPGGGLLQDSTSAASAMYYSGIIMMARLMKKPAYMLSQGIGPLRGQAARAVGGAALRRCEKIWTRDEHANEQLLSLGVAPGRAAVSADMVSALYAAGDINEKTSVSSDLKIGVSLRPDRNLRKITDAINDAVIKLNAEHKSISLLPFDNHEDNAPCEVAAAKFSASEGVKAATLRIENSRGGGDSNEKSDNQIFADDILRAYKNFDIFIGMRLHSLVFAALAKIPFVAISYDPKVAGFAKRCGMPVIENPEDMSAEQLRGAIGELTRDGGAAAREKISRAMEEQKNAVEKMVRELAAEIEARATMNTLGIPVSGMGIEETIEEIISCAKNKKKMRIVTINPEMVLRAKKEEEFRTLLRSGTVNTPDGVGVRIAIRIKYGKRLESVTGAALTHRLLEVSRERNIRIYMIGGAKDVIEKTRANIEKRPDRPLVVGYHHGYIRGMDMEALAAEIRSAAPDVILAGMGVPMQEYWARDYGDLTGASVIMGIGGMFDVLAGVKKRAPALFQKIGMEWLWRLLSEPTRFKRIAPLPLYLPMAMMDRFRRGA